MVVGFFLEETVYKTIEEITDAATSNPCTTGSMQGDDDPSSVLLIICG
jgi:hypothetical protein